MTSSLPILPSTTAAERRAALLPLRVVLWLYLFLWVIEGALRKWILPSQANPLLVVRDPFLLLLYLMALWRGIFPKNIFVIWTAVQGALAMTASVMTTDVPLVIELYGLRASYLHLPLIFVIPAVFDGNDVRRVGFWTLLCSLPMAVLVLLQFTSRSTAWLNAGAGGTMGSMIESAYGHIRPSGTFSFTNGLAGFSVVVSAFFLWQLFEVKLYPRLLWLASGGALVVLIALSGSRSAVGAVGLILAAAVVISIVQPRYWGSTIKLLALVGLGVLLIGSFSVFKEGLNVFASRFGDAQNVQTGFFGRFFDSLYKPFYSVEFAQTWGAGLGLGTNAASGIINDGKRAFMLSEGDIARVILESGPLIGIAYQFLRTLIALALGVEALRSLYQRANTLPILIFSGIFSVLFSGEFAQPTKLGYATIAAGLCLAANNARGETNNPVPGPIDTVVIVAPRTPVRRGRSLYAEAMQSPKNGSEEEQPSHHD